MDKKFYIGTVTAELKNTVREFSHKISIYIGANFIITVHQKETDIFDLVLKKYIQNMDPSKVSIKGILYRIVSETIKTYEEPAKKKD